MKHNQYGFGLIGVVMIILIVGVIAIAGYGVFRASTTSKESSTAPDSKALVSIASRGGNCANGPCEHPVFNIYEDGTFEGHRKLQVAEIKTLKNVIATTDFLAIKPNPSPQCASFADGTDVVLYFPQKYGDKAFIPCELQIDSKNSLFKSLNQLVGSS